MARPKLIRHPAVPEEWEQNLRRSSVRVGFYLNLSKAMLEFLCATAEGVMWDRALYYTCSACPENWLASSHALIKRGLLERLPQEEIDARKYDDTPRAERTCYMLTPAGQLVVGLLRMAGMFVEADAAINKKARKA